MIDITGTDSLYLGELGGVILKIRKNEVLLNQNLNKIRSLEGYRVSELLFQLPTRSGDIGGSWRGEPKILENA